MNIEMSALKAKRGTFVNPTTVDYRLPIVANELPIADFQLPPGSDYRLWQTRGTDRQAERQASRNTDTDTQTDRQTERKTGKHRQLDKQKGRKSDTLTDGQAN
jgi:hypothetical protein